MFPNPGRLIVFEGIDGSGKTTQARILADVLREGCHVISTAEPTHGQYGRRLREIYANKVAITPEAEMGLLLTDRHEHCEQLVDPALASGAIVIQDRSWLSTIAYQTGATYDAGEIQELNKFASNIDVAFILDVRVKTALERIGDRAKGMKTSMESVGKLTLARAIYRTIGEGESAWTYVINGEDRCAEEISEEIMEILLNIDGFF